eukprot:7745151-Ditylum_brightwellii.AAC.1
MGISATLWGQFKALGYCNPWKTHELITPICVGLGVMVAPIVMATGWHAQDLGNNEVFSTLKALRHPKCTSDVSQFGQEAGRKASGKWMCFSWHSSNQMTTDIGLLDKKQAQGGTGLCGNEI